MACEFRFFNPRLDAAEEGRIYAGYRSEEYQRMRQASEPWYTVNFNASLASPDVYERRRQRLRAILRPHVGSREIKRILDYGGDQGDLVRGLFEGAAAFVYEISGVRPVNGVTSIADPVECKADLVINCNVLEHVSFPNRVVKEILRAVPSGGVLYLEVPRESPFALARFARRIVQVGIMSLMRPALTRWVVRPASLYMMHEHVNYFGERSLRALMNSCGCGVIATGNYVVSSGVEKGNIVWCLGAATLPRP